VFSGMGSSSLVPRPSRQLVRHASSALVKPPPGVSRNASSLLDAGQCAKGGLRSRADWESKKKLLAVSS